MALDISRESYCGHGGVSVAPDCRGAL
jgi:hypothetical protein